jgi:glycosyltransferase involved in cell wall biosynthesis
MRVSAVIPTFNHRPYIGRAIDSILAQTAAVNEVIVIDDGSSDGTAESIRAKYGRRIRVVTQQNQGVSGARRRGVQEANGDWIAFLDSDDTWAPDRNREFLEAAALVPHDVAWIFGDLRVVSDNGEGTTLFQEFGLSVTQSPHVFTDTLSVHFPFQFGLLQGSFIRRNVLLELDCFNEGLQHSEDLLAGFQVACRYKFAAIPSIVGQYFRTSDLTANSAVIKGMYGADYFRSRMLCFELVIKSGRRRPWNMLYASAVQGLCKVLARQRKSPRSLALRQFKYGGLSAKGIALCGAAMFGWRGLQMWDALAKFRNKVRPQDRSILVEDGFRASVESAARTKTG